MGSKTVTRLSSLIVVVGLMSPALYFLWRLQVGRKADSVVTQADRKAEQGDFVKAEELYTQYLAVVRNDVEVQLKLADTSLKIDKSQKRLQEALARYEGILRQYPGRTDVRRRAAETAVEMGGGWFEKARGYLKSLLEATPDDGHLEYLMARCEEQDGEFDRAAKYYRGAIEHAAPERLEASQGLALLLRDKLGKREEADRVIDAMVSSVPGDYRVYLVRGLYRERGRGRGGPGGGEDLRKAQQLAPDRPDVYLELSRAVEHEKGLDAAREVLDKGLATAPKAIELYLALSNLEHRAGRLDRATEALELGLKVLPDEINLRGQLSLLLANRGDTGRLLTQITELERIGASRPFTQYLTACYYYNKQEFIRARQILAPLQPEVVGSPFLKSLVQLLLSRCYAELSEPELQWEATLRALSVDPKNMTARLNWIQSLVARGDLDEAIREYRALFAEQPGLVRLPLASLLLERNRRLPPAQRQWDEAERLIDEATTATPGAPEPVLMRAQMLQDRDQEAKALDLLETARGRFPKHPGPWTAQAEILIRQKKLEKAQEVLDRARQLLGDRVDLRLLRARLAVARGGPQVIPALNELGRDIEPFSREDRRRLLTEQAFELSRQQDLAGAARAWSRLVEQEPQRLLPRFQLFDLALQTKDRAQAEAQIRAITDLDEQFGQFCRSQYLVWQAQGGDAAAKEKLRGEARILLTDLKARRPDWLRVPLALARLSEQELDEAGLDEAQKRDKLESTINSYRRAIELGLREPGIVRHVVELLFRAGRGSEALEVYSQIPALVHLTGDLGRRASQIALANRDYRHAEEIARKAVEASPQDFQARVWLAQVLMEARRPDDAEIEIRQAIDGSKSDPDRWITLLRFAVLTHQSEKAEQAVRDAELYLSTKPLALAQCCQIVANTYTAADPDRARTWFDKARQWFDKAQAGLKDPNDLTVKRRFAEFLLQANQVAEAEGVLKEILARGGDGKSQDLVAWARRSLAQVYAIARPPRTAEALALFAGTPGGAGADADDLRVLALIHEVQATPEGRRLAIADLEALTAREAASTEDRRRLAQLLDAAGEWQRAREQFRELILRTDGARDAETIARRPRYIALFAETLIRHHRPGGDPADLAEARQMAAKLRSIPNEAMTEVILQAAIDKADNQLDAANARLRDLADRPGLTVDHRIRLANVAEQLGLLDAAESIYRRVAAQPPADPNQFPLALFLARRGRIKDALDLCESLRADPALRERVAALSIEIVANPLVPLDEVQTRRVLAWLEAGVAAQPQSLMYLLGLGNIHERLGDYPGAMQFYRNAIKLNDRDGIACNNLAWLLVLNGGKRDEALELINNAIRVKGAVPEYLDTRGMVYLNAGNGPRAIADLEKALAGAPNGAKYFHLAQAYLQVNEMDKARKSLEAGKTRGLPRGLHPLELAIYNQVAGKLGGP